MEEAEARKARLRAMRATVEAEPNSAEKQGYGLPAPILGSPLRESPAGKDFGQQGHIRARFDFYSDPLAGYTRHNQSIGSYQSNHPQPSGRDRGSDSASPHLGAHAQNQYDAQGQQSVHAFQMAQQNSAWPAPPAPVPPGSHDSGFQRPLFPPSGNVRSWTEVNRFEPQGLLPPGSHQQGVNIAFSREPQGSRRGRGSGYGASSDSSGRFSHGGGRAGAMGSGRGFSRDGSQGPFRGPKATRLDEAGGRDRPNLYYQKSMLEDPWKDLFKSLRTASSGVRKGANEAGHL